MERSTRTWMVAGTAAALLGIALGIPYLVDYGRSGLSDSPLFLPAVLLSIAGGFATYAAGLLRSQEKIRIVRDWKLHPVSGKVLWITGLVLLMAYTAVFIGTFGDGNSTNWSWLIGVYFSLLGWSSALMVTAANSRRITAAEREATAPRQ